MALTRTNARSPASRGTLVWNFRPSTAMARSRDGGYARLGRAARLCVQYVEAGGNKMKKKLLFGHQFSPEKFDLILLAHFIRQCPTDRPPRPLRGEQRTNSIVMPAKIAACMRF